MEGITVRKMSPTDLPEVLAIADRSFTTPWSRSSFEYEIRNKDAILRAAELEGRVIGYVCARFFLDIVHIMDIAVIQGERRKGAGSMLLTDTLKEIKKTRPGTEHITLEVRESNIPAIKLYEKAGFRETGRRKDYYTGPKEYGIIMSLDTVA